MNWTFAGDPTTKDSSAGELPRQDFVVEFRRNTIPMNRRNDGAVWERERSFPESFDRYIVAELNAQLVELARD